MELKCNAHRNEWFACFRGEYKAGGIECNPALFMKHVAEAKR